MRRRLALLAVLSGALCAACAPLVETGRFTVIDSGTGPKLCSIVQESYPPGCGGDPVPVLDWDWDDWEHEVASGVRWVEGDFTVTRVGDNVRLAATEN